MVYEKELGRQSHRERKSHMELQDSNPEIEIVRKQKVIELIKEKPIPI